MTPEPKTLRSSTETKILSFQAYLDISQMFSFGLPPWFAFRLVFTIKGAIKLNQNGEFSVNFFNANITHHQEGGLLSTASAIRMYIRASFFIYITT